MDKDFVEGHVLDEFGNPVPGAFVTLQAEDEYVRDIASITGDRGNFRLTAPYGDFSLTATTKSGMYGVARLSKFSAERFAPIITLHYIIKNGAKRFSS